MILFIFGYFVMGLMFLILRFFYHISQKNSRKNLIHEIKKDFSNFYAYAKQIILTNPAKIKIIVGLITIFIILVTVQIENLIIVDEFVSAIIFFIMVIVFAPKEENSQKKFPVEIFGFIYSIVMMYVWLCRRVGARSFFHR